VTIEVQTAFRREVDRCGIASIVAHDSYLINLATPDPVLLARSETSFRGELERCEALGIGFVVSHPGNYIDDREAGIVRNAAAYTRCLTAVPGATMVLLETTAGTGTSLGATFEELVALRGQIGADVRHRVGYCVDTCHLYSAGYDLVGDFDGVWQKWEAIIGFEHLRCIHLNDSKTPFSSRRDRHEVIGEGSLGPNPFRNIMRDPRFARIPKLLETPKGDDEFTEDRRMLRRLRAYARVPRAR
jgi:deoxyribonuclease-4